MSWMDDPMLRRRFEDAYAVVRKMFAGEEDMADPIEFFQARVAALPLAEGGALMTALGHLLVRCGEAVQRGDLSGLEPVRQFLREGGSPQSQPQ